MYWRYGIVKKLGEAEENNKGSSAEIELDNIILASLERGLSINDIKGLKLGQCVDFCIAYNERQEDAEKRAEREERRGKRRKATQADINGFFG